MPFAIEVEEVERLRSCCVKVKGKTRPWFGKHTPSAAFPHEVGMTPVTPAAASWSKKRGFNPRCRRPSVLTSITSAPSHPFDLCPRVRHRNPSQTLGPAVRSKFLEQLIFALQHRSGQQYPSTLQTASRLHCSGIAIGISGRDPREPLPASSSDTAFHDASAS
eukprot:CAMPEP_0181309198 /NCGR_PEP_ID=MMETSP1101-20121128/11884_1 /TAXON_ID=46948 /ORGANISM="Rhodomonas abbreviata, Strain Caron Lab Isolate" /LENGTH=162 /DNA_ID=CAMNT_0023415663 /DNA_START=234 /DNA_END=722 /DNA_ORIENTATION=-